MRVKVKLFATLARYVPGIKPGEPFEVGLHNGATLSDLINQLKLQQTETILDPEEAKLIFVNGIAQPLNYQLKNNDEVGIFSPIGGG